MTILCLVMGMLLLYVASSSSTTKFLSAVIGTKVLTKKADNSSISATGVNAKLVYLIQTTTPRHDNRILPDENRDVIFLCFIENCTPNGTVSQSDILVKPNVTWSEGRNLLLEHAIQRSKHREDLGYDYYIFLDDDIPEVMTDTNAFDRFERFLLDARPGIGFPLMKPYFAPFNVDAMFNAFHRSTFGLLLPYNEHLDEASIYHSQLTQNYMIGTMAACQRRGALGNATCATKENKHRESSNYKRLFTWSVAKKNLSTLFRSPMTRDAFQLLARANVASENWGNYDTCCRKEGETTTLYEDGPVDSDFIKEHLNTEHKYAQSLLDFHQRHEKWLTKIRGSSKTSYGLEIGCSDNTLWGTAKWMEAVLNKLVGDNHCRDKACLTTTTGLSDSY